MAKEQHHRYKARIRVSDLYEFEFGAYPSESLGEAKNPDNLSGVEPVNWDVEILKLEDLGVDE